MVLQKQKNTSFAKNSESKQIMISFGTGSIEWKVFVFIKNVMDTQHLGYASSVVNSPKIKIYILKKPSILHFFKARNNLYECWIKIIVLHQHFSHNPDSDCKEGSGLWCMSLARRWRMAGLTSPVWLASACGSAWPVAYSAPPQTQYSSQTAAQRLHRTEVS